MRAPALARWSPSTASAGSAISPCSTRGRWALRRSRINRGTDKEPLARQLGAHHYIDASAHDTVAELQKLGGARVILATAPNAQAISALVDGLAVSGTLVVPAAPAEPLTINVLSLISGRRSVAGCYAG